MLFFKVNLKTRVKNTHFFGCWFTTKSIRKYNWLFKLLSVNKQRMSVTDRHGASDSGKNLKFKWTNIYSTQWQFKFALFKLRYHLMAGMRFTNFIWTWTLLCNYKLCNYIIAYLVNLSPRSLIRCCPVPIFIAIFYIFGKLNLIWDFNKSIC